MDIANKRDLLVAVASSAAAAAARRNRDGEEWDAMADGFFFFAWSTSVLHLTLARPLCAADFVTNKIDLVSTFVLQVQVLL